ncbi:hypothetical protein QAD02_001258 [Eretmocerus hayati]|uniref:Uncharacterized protein n=1 Tax=Eretmocerus hayati TaxID=131215 RepID=A0ACC2NFH6_9HYME|nr:hypothetical protein QAD02_001258 [Eretmocerus hayati]
MLINIRRTNISAGYAKIPQTPVTHNEIDGQIESCIYHEDDFIDEDVCNTRCRKLRSHFKDQIILGGSCIAGHCQCEFDTGNTLKTRPLFSLDEEVAKKKRNEKHNNPEELANLKKYHPGRK